MRWLLLIIPGGVGVPTAVALVARHLVERHADEYALGVRRAFAARPAADRPKAGVR